MPYRSKVAERVRLQMRKSNTHTDNIAKTAFLIMFISIVGRGLGLVRESILASKYGASFETDAFKVAFSIPTMILFTLSASIATTLIPVYTDMLKQDSREKANDYINNMMNIVAFISYVIIVIGISFTPAIVKIIAPGFHSDVFDLAVKLSIITMPSILFYALTNISEGFLQVNKVFAITVFTAIPFNLFIIAGILFPGYSIGAAAVGSLLAVACQFLIQIPFMRKSGYRYKMVMDLKDKNIRKTLRLMIPVLISSTFSQAYLFISKMLASVLVAGSISALDYADKANYIVYNIIVSPIIVVVYPRLSFIHDNLKQFCNHIMTTLNAIIYIAFPITAILFVLRVPIISILYERGIFGRQDTLATSTALGFFSLGIPAICVYALLTKAFYSMKDTKTPMTNDIFIVVLNIVLSLILVSILDIGGLALSVSVASTAGCIFMLIRLKRKLALLDLKKIAETLLQALTASYLMGALIFIINGCGLFTLENQPTFIVKSGILALIISIGIITYIGLLYAMKVEELDSIVKKIKSRMKNIMLRR